MSYVRSLSQHHFYTSMSAENGFLFPTNTGYMKYLGTKSGTNVAHWRSKIRQGNDATGAYTLDNYSLEMKPGYAHWAAHDMARPPNKVTQYSGWFSGNSSGPSSALTHLTTNLSAANAAALKQVYSKLAQQTSHTNSLATLGEMADTIRMIRHPFRAIAELTQNHVNRLVKSKRGLRGSERQRFEKYYELVRSSYLEYVFGLAPLISDTVAITETIARWNLENEGIRKERTRIVGRGEDVNVSHFVSTSGQHYQGGFNVYRYQHIQKITTTRKVQYVCGVSLPGSAPAGSTERLTELLGFNFRNFLPSVWEVIPWSWLVDYVLNVSDLIEAGVSDTSSVRWVSKTVSEDSVEEYTSPALSDLISQRLAAYSLVGGGSGSFGSYRLRRTTLTRTPGVSLGMPDLTVSLPTNFKKYANVYAAVFALRSPSAFRLRNPY